MGQPLPKSWMELISAIGDEQEERDMPTAACQVQQKVQAEIVTPMDVLHHEEHGMSCRLFRQEMGHGSEEPSLLLFWTNRRRCREGRQVGEEQCQVGQQARECRDECVHVVCEGGRGITRKIRPEEVKQRRVRERAVRLETISLKEEKVPLRGIGFCLSDQARLANARFTADEDRLPSLPLSTDLPINEHVQGGEVEMATNQRGTDEHGSHRFSHGNDPLSQSR